MAKTLWSRNGQENDNSENGGGSSKLGPQGQERSPSSAQDSMMALRPSKSGLFSRIKGIGRPADSSQGQGNNNSPGSSAFSSSTPTPRPRPTQTTAEKRRAEALKANGLLPASRRYSALLPPDVVWTEPKADTGDGKGGMSAADLVKREWEARTVGEREGGGSAVVEREAEDRNVNANVDEPRPPPRTPGKPKKKPDLAIAVLPDRPSPGTKGRVSGTHSPKAVFNSWKFPSSPNLNTSNLGTPTFSQTVTAASPISAPGSDTDEEEDSASEDDSGTHDALLSPRFIPLPRSPGRSPKESRFLFAPPSPSLIPLPASPHPSQSYFDGHSRGQVIPLTPNLIPLPASPLPSQSYFDNSGTSCPPTPRHIPLPISRAPTPSPIPSPLPSPRLAPQKPIPSFPLPPVPPSPRFVPLPTSPSPNALAFSTATSSHGSPPVSEKVSQWLTRSPTGATASRESLVHPPVATVSTFPLIPVSPVVRSWSNSMTTTTTATTSTADVPPPPPLSPSASSTLSPSPGTTDVPTPPSAALSALPTFPPSVHTKDTRSASNPNRTHHKAHLSQSSTTSTSSTSSNVLNPERAFLLADRGHVDQDLELSDLTLELPPVPIFPAARAEEKNQERSSSPLSFGSFSKRRTTMMAGTVTASTPREPRKSINLFGRRKATNETPPLIYTGKSPIGTDESSTRGSTNGNGSINKRKSILPSFARSKSSTMPHPNLSALQSPPLPASPASGMSFATGSSSGHGWSGKQGQGEKEKSSNAKRMPLSPTMHSRATIMAQAGRIEDDDTRRLTEMAFLS